MKNLNDFALQYLQNLKQQSLQPPVPDIELSGSTASQLENIYPTLYQTEMNATIIALSNKAETLAAVSGRFAPNDLLTLTSDTLTDQQVLSRLVTGCIVETVDSKVQWLLNQSRRETALRPLIQTGTLDAILSQPLPATDLLGKMLRDILNEGDGFSIANRTHTELLAISAAAEALADLNVPLPDRAELRYQLNKESLLAGYDVLLKGSFIGRKPQLQTLDLFLRQGNEKAGNNRWGGLIVTGYGGAGKSTLLAKFAQRVAKESTATVIMLDFDRPGIDPSPNDTFWLEAEMTRQVGLQYPKQYERLRDIRSQTRQRRTEFVNYEGLAQSADSFSKSRNVRSLLVLAIKNALQSERMEYRPLLLVLDTFEEVIQRELAGRVFDWLAEIGDALTPSPLRVIFSGRLFDTSLAVFARQGLANPLLVNELEPSQAERLLKHLNVAEPMAKRLTRSGLFPLRPLELQLLAKVANRDESAASIEELEAEIRYGGEKSSELFIGIIYRRILLRIKDPATELLAYPGLVLRYVTPELIQKVLGPALALPLFTLEEAEKALKKLATYEWLVEQKINDGRLEVWHRRDLRQSMLRLMLTDDPAKTRRISEAASQYFNNGSERDQAEALYHRLLWMDTPVEGEQYELDQLKQMAVILGGYVSDLPKVATVLLQFAQKGSVQASDVSLLPARYLTSAYHKTGRRLINSREFAKALRLLRRGQKEGIFGQKAHGELIHDLWEKDTLFATACWNELSYKPSVIPVANTPLQDVANRFYPAAITDPSDVLLTDITNWLGKIDHLSPFQTAELQAPDIAGLLTNLALSIVAIHNRVPLAIERSTIIRSIIETARSHFQLRRSARLQRKLVLLSFTGASPAIDSFWLAPSLLRFDLPWLQQLAMISQKVGLKAEVNSLLNETIATFQAVLTGRQPTVRQLLRTMDSLYKERDQWAQVCFSLSTDFNDAEVLMALFRGPDSEFRDPCRFALLEAYPDPSSRRQLGQLIRSVVPLPLIDLTPDAFVDSLAADPEHALESYIELVDRAWQLGPLLRLAATSRPDATKLKTVLSAYERWDMAVRLLFSSFFNSSHKTQTNMITADLERKATLGTMIRLISDESEATESPGHEPITSAEEFEGRNGYNPDFLTGWHIALPKATGAKATDMRELRRGGAGVELRYQNFSSILSISRRMPLITAVNISGRESRSLPRINTWSFDGRLDKTDQWGDELYAGNALDRGHMVRREDPVWGTFEEAQQANADTFHFTNSCPQMAAVNQKTWVGLENYVLQHARADQMRVTVFTGPYFSDSDLHYRGALVPKAFWKVVAIVTETGRPSATAYKVSQEQDLQELEFVFGAYKTYQISIRQVMTDTGIDFNALVPFDGFSTEEANTGNSMTETLETLASIRI